MKISHIAIKVDDLETAGDFYQTFLGFRDVRQGRERDHFPAIRPTEISISR